MPVTLTGYFDSLSTLSCSWVAICDACIACFSFSASTCAANCCCSGGGRGGSVGAVNLFAQVGNLLAQILELALRLAELVLGAIESVG